MTMQQNTPDFPGPDQPICPDCKAPMRISAVRPLQSSSRSDELTYRCNACGMLSRQIVKPLAC
jgi:hypothetical protein